MNIIDDLFKNHINNGYSDKQKISGYWNKERCQKESLKYKNRYSLQKGNISVYNASYDNKWLDEFFPKY